MTAIEIINLASITGARFILEANRLRLIPDEGKSLDPVLIEIARKNKDQLIMALSPIIPKSCCICGDTRALFGELFDWHDPDKTRWYCSKHYQPISEP